MNVDLFDLGDKVVVSCMAVDKDLVAFDIETFKGNRVSVYFKSNRLQDFINSLEVVCVQLRGFLREPVPLLKNIDNIEAEVQALSEKDIDDAFRELRKKYPDDEEPF